MPAFKVDIALGNDEMQTAEDVAKALEQVADRVRNYTGLTNETHYVQDRNGNTVGTFWGQLIDESALNARANRNDWKYEVANGDTVLGFEEWLAHRDEANQVNLDNWVPGEDVDTDESVRAEVKQFRLLSGDKLSKVDLEEWEPGENVDEDSLVENELAEFRKRTGLTSR